jgi:hypothetical protein
VRPDRTCGDRRTLIEIEWLAGDGGGALPAVARCDGCSAGLGVNCMPVDARNAISIGTVDQVVLRLQADVPPPSGSMLEIR